jgi:hypothetical protein
VATDQKTRIVAAEFDPSGAPIENELPAYRAISRSAVFSLLVGALSICCFAHPFFYLFAFLSVALGIWANYSIRRRPDMLTGARVANVGIALGMIFGLTSATVATVQSVVRTQAAERFAKKYAETLKESTEGTALWYNLHPSQRSSKTPMEMMQEFQSAKGKERFSLNQKMGGLMKLRARLGASPSNDVRFVRIERVGEDDTHGGELDIFATALFGVHGPEAAGSTEKEEFALAIMKARPKGRQYEWWIDNLIFPYAPESFVAPEKPVGDGHAH